MTSHNTFDNEPTVPLVVARGEDVFSPVPQQPEDLPAEYETPNRPKSLWRRMMSPLYAVGVGPWIALFSLIVLGVMSYTFLLPALPLAAAGAIFGSSGALLLVPVVMLLGFLTLPLLGLWFGYFERWRIELAGHGKIASGHVPVPLHNFGEWLKVRYTEAATWREVASLVFGAFMASIAGLIVLLETIILMIAGVVWYYLAINRDPLNIWYDPSSFGLNTMFQSQVELYRHSDPLMFSNLNLDHPNWVITPDMWWLAPLSIFIVLFFFAYINGLLAATSTTLSKLILSPRPEEYERKVAKLTASRTTIVDSFESERRRIERNLHDGVQQELVNINLRLGLAEMEAKNLVAQGLPVESIQQQLTQSKTELTHALQTLRNTVRGIYPAVLEDHGLYAALEELARHSVIPTKLNFQLRERPRREVERVAYYTVNEAITNTLKHTAATRITVNVWDSLTHLMVEVIDNGGGGADPSAGTGLAGLRERAEALGGNVQVTSVPGESSTIALSVPLHG
ncbi:hypothetical protein HF984_02485 [Rothia terrae]|uniref:sensor histidine kinase n=1 Tax=Rothia terrae TaxID=396015 RepID=UPI0014468C95|nr:histidine kinase [Rothia terrae]MDT0189625.1 histidine kinase [Rothia terrae]NKZ33651.1 hypothetical protein [Rothia terrae]